MSNRLTWGLEKSVEGGWKVVHEHSSAPVDFETGRVQLERVAER
jgi:ketosteroid isomerase-like protein